MDNTLPVYIAVYGDDTVLPAVANGVLLTLAAPLLLIVTLSL